MPSRPECSVVVAVDGSTAALAAARWAARTAILRGVPLLVVHAGHDASVLATAAAAAAEEVAPADLTIRTTLVDREPAPAPRHRAPLLVIGSPRRPASTTRTPGSALTAARRYGSVLVVAPALRRVGDGPVVIGIGSRGNSAGALDFALHEAALRGTDLVAIHASTPDTPHSDDHERGHRLISDALVGYGEKYPTVSITRIVTHGDPSRLLLRAAHDARLIVLGAGPDLGALHREVLTTTGVPVAIVARG